MATTPDVAVLRAQILAEFPKFKTVHKSTSFWMRLISRVLGKKFLTDFATTILSTVYVPDAFETFEEASQCATLRHERVHMRQARKLTFPLFAFLYLLVFLPVGLAYFRARFEMEAYAETQAAWKDYGRDYFSPDQRAWYVDVFTGPAYAWMWPFPGAIGRWFDGVVKGLDG